MKIDIVEKKKDRMVISIDGEDHTFCAALKKELWNDKHVKAAGYHIDHPLIGKPRIVVETDGEDPIKCIESACKRLDKQFDELKTAVVKAVK